MANCSHEVLRLITPDEYGDARLYAKEACLIMDSAKAELDPSPLTTESLIQEFGFKPEEMRPDYLWHGRLVTWMKFSAKGDFRRWWIGNNELTGGPLCPQTKGQLRRLLALIQDIQASLGGEEGQG